MFVFEFAYLKISDIYTCKSGLCSATKNGIEIQKKIVTKCEVEKIFTKVTLLKEEIYIFFTTAILEGMRKLSDNF